MDDFRIPVFEIIVNVLSFEDPFSQISSPDYKNVLAAFKKRDSIYL